MTSTSGCSHQLKKIRLSDTSCTMDDSSNMSDFATVTLTREFDHATGSTSYFSAMEEQIELSKAHWSTLVYHSVDTDEEEVEVDFEVSNKHEFQALQRHPIGGDFFGNFTGDGMSTGSKHRDFGELVIGNKFAEGGQAELFEAHIKWNLPWNVELDRREGNEYALKVFKEGSYLKHVKSQLPLGLLLEKTFARDLSTISKLPRWTSMVYFGILLKGGRFAFLMRKDDCDLRSLIEQNMKLRSGEECRPFSKEEAEYIMYCVALGVSWLHDRDIIHRDLKASNVLICHFENGWICDVADYECSIGVVGTGFFRAPEILHACKERKINERPEVFSRAADVYSYAMTCYEILTGKLPFEDHASKGSPSLLIDLVVNQGLRPEVPKYVEDWTRELLGTCWQVDPASRPTIGRILDVLSTNSVEARRLKDRIKEEFGENFEVSMTLRF